MLICQVGLLKGTILEAGRRMLLEVRLGKSLWKLTSIVYNIRAGSDLEEQPAGPKTAIQRTSLYQHRDLGWFGCNLAQARIHSSKANTMSRVCVASEL